MTTIRTTSCLVSLFAVAACGPAQSTDSATEAAVKSGSTKSSTKTPPKGLAGSYTLLTSDACGGIFNGGDASTIAATSSSLTISQADQTSSTGEDVFFTAKIGDVFQRPNQFDIDHGYTQTDRQIAGYNESGSSFLYKEYRYDMSLTDEEGLATGWFQTIELKTDSSGVAYELTYSDGENYHCSFASQN